MWVARNKKGKLKVFADKPIRKDDYWYSANLSLGFNKKNLQVGTLIFNIILYYNMFDNLTWEDEPVNIFVAKANKSYIKVADTCIYIARDKYFRYNSNTKLNLFATLPIIDNGIWRGKNGTVWMYDTIDISIGLGLFINASDFDNLTYKDKPIKLEVYVGSLKS